MRTTALFACLLACACGGNNGGSGGGSGGGGGGGGSGGGSGGGTGTVVKVVKLLDVSGMVSLTGTDDDAMTVYTTTSSSMTVSLDSSTLATSSGITGNYVAAAGMHTFHMQVPMLEAQSAVVGTSVQNGVSSNINLPASTGATQLMVIDAMWTSEADFAFVVAESPCPNTTNGPVPNARPLKFSGTGAQIESGSFTFTATDPVTDMASAGGSTWNYQRSVNLTVSGLLQ